MNDVMKLTENSTAILSNTLIALTKGQDLSRQRLVLSAVGAFDPYNKVLTQMLMEWEVKEKESRKGKESEFPKVAWTIEDYRKVVSDFFLAAPQASIITFDLSEYLSFWLKKESVQSKNYVSLYKKIINDISTITYSLDGDEGITTVSVFSKASLEDGLITLHLSPDFLPYIALYNRPLQSIGYTKIRLDDIRGSKMENTTRLYSLLLKEFNRVGKHKGYVDFSVEKLRIGLGIGSKYSKYCDLDRYVLDTALKSINQSGTALPKNIKHEVTRRRRRVPVDLRFTFGRNDGGRKTEYEKSAESKT